jgi:hypothetical protein
MSKIRRISILTLLSLAGASAFAQSASAYTHADRVEIRQVAIQAYTNLLNYDWVATCDTLTPYERTDIIQMMNQGKKHHFKSCASAYTYFFKHMPSSEKKWVMSNAKNTLKWVKHSRVHIEFRRNWLSPGVDAEMSPLGSHNSVQFSKVNGVWLLGRQIGKPHYTG